MKLKINEIFKSIDGEANGFLGMGQFTTFIRFQGCNLDCPYCDTKYASESSAGTYKEMSIEEILIEVGDAKKVTITGGEPLLQREGFEALIVALGRNRLITVETNGTQKLRRHTGNLFLNVNVRYVVDYKLPTAYGNINVTNKAEYWALRPFDVIKFVIFSLDDYEIAKHVISEKNIIASSMAQKVLSLGIKTGKRTGPVVEHEGELLRYIIKDHDERFCIQVQLHKILNTIYGLELK